MEMPEKIEFEVNCKLIGFKKPDETLEQAQVRLAFEAEKKLNANLYGLTPTFWGDMEFSGRAHITLKEVENT